MLDQSSQNETLAHAAYTSLLGEIVNCGLSPGTYTSEAELSDLVGCGRTPVREAVQRLAQEGFCQILPRRGLLINPIDYAHQLDVVGVRLILEPAAAALAAERISPVEAEKLKQLLKSLEKESTVKQKAAQPTTADEELHREVAEVVRNDVLTSTLLPLYAHSRRLWVHEHRRGLKEPSAIVEEWTRIVDGVTSGDAKASFDGMKDHVVAARTAILHGDGR